MSLKDVYREKMEAKLAEQQARLDLLKARAKMAVAGFELVPRFLEHYPAIVWEDHDECLEVQPDDINP